MTTPSHPNLVALHCAIPRDYLSDSPLSRERQRGGAKKRGAQNLTRSDLLSHMLCTFCLAIRATIYRSLQALRGQNRKKVSKRVFLGVCKKVPQNTRKNQKLPQKVQFWRIFDFFGYFRGLLCRPPKRLFLRLFCDFGPGGPGDSCKWSLGSQILSADDSGQLLWDSVEIAQNRRRTKSTEHASKKIRPSKRLKLYIFLGTYTGVLQEGLRGAENGEI